MRTILHCDMNNFYASVECLLDPSLAGRRVAVCGSAEERHGIVLAKNEAAKKCGVSTGEPIWQAKRKCPDLVTVPPRYREYVKFSQEAKKLYLSYTELVESFGLDECWLDVTASRTLFGDGRSIADDIRRRIREELGLTVSVGVSFNKVFAKLGSDMKKPDATTVIGEDFRETVWKLPVSAILGAGPAVTKRLSQMGIHTLGQLAVFPEEPLRAALGKQGLLLRNYANGTDDSPVIPASMEPPAKSVSRGFTTPEDLGSYREVKILISRLSREVAAALRRDGLRAGGVSLRLRFPDLTFECRQTKLDIPLHNEMFIADAAFRLYMTAFRRKLPVRSVTVEAFSLESDDSPRQMTLFGDSDRLLKAEKLDPALDAIRGRYGKDAVLRGILVRESGSDGRELPPDISHGEGFKRKSDPDGGDGA